MEEKHANSFVGCWVYIEISLIVSFFLQFSLRFQPFYVHARYGHVSNAAHHVSRTFFDWQFRWTRVDEETSEKASVSKQRASNSVEKFNEWGNYSQCGQNSIVNRINKRERRCNRENIKKKKEKKRNKNSKTTSNETAGIDQSSTLRSSANVCPRE